MPLVFASGAGASTRKSLGIAVASGMLASMCLAVLFVVLQQFAERKTVKREEQPSPTPPAPPGATTN